MPVLTPRESTFLARRVLIECVVPNVEVDIPDGWIIAKKKTCAGDRFLSLDSLSAGEVVWEDVRAEHLNPLHPRGGKNYYIYASAFGCLIRRMP